MKQITLLFLLAFLFSCAKEQPKAAWLKIDHWDFVENPDAVNNQGELSHNFTQVFVNMDGEFIGSFELPAKIPIIAENGDHDFVILPGVISNDGMMALKTRYPFAEQYQGTINLIQDDTVSVIPTTRYFSNLNFLLEDFESPSMQLDVAEESLATLGRDNDPEFLQWGNRYGKVELNEIDSIITFMTTFETVLPKLATKVYLEFDYLNTNSMLTSIVSHGNGQFYDDPFLIAAPQEEGKAKWKHAYYNLEKVVSFRQTVPINEAQFQLILDDELTSSYIYIDNIKIIYP